MMKQKGFTLLELLVVVTILAVLAAGALVAYDGIGESSKSAADSNNIATIDGAIRTYKVVESALPNQFDSLLADDGTALATGILHEDLEGVLARWAQTNVSDVGSEVAEGFTELGFDELQAIEAGTTAAAAAAVTGGINMAHNELGAVADEVDVDGLTQWAVVVGFDDIGPTTGACTAGGATFSTPLVGAAVTSNAVQNRINDLFAESESDGNCNLIIAVGFGNDAAQSTTSSGAAIQAAAASSSVNKNTYGRYIALFHVGADLNDNQNLNDANEIFETPRFIGLIAPNGKTLNETIADAKGVE